MQMRMVLDSCPRRESGWEKPWGTDFPEVCRSRKPFFQGPPPGAQVVFLAISSTCSEELHGKFHQGKTCLFYLPSLTRSSGWVL